MTTWVELPDSWPQDFKELFAACEKGFWSKDAFEKYEYFDNVRVARVTCPEEVAKYMSRRETGCCGQFDVLWPIGGDLILYGFDYGH